MKTVFKVGMEVYDQLFYPNQKGIIKKIHNNNPEIHFPIEVEFNGEIETYTLKGSCNYLDLITLSTSPYTLQGFEQKEPAPTYEEAWEEAERVYEPKSEYDKEEYGGYPTQKLADASEALRRLLFLRDYYNEGWQPDWSNKMGEWKFCIVTYENRLNKDTTFSVGRILTFKTEEIRDKFLKEQKELLEIAKPLL